jgi:hypothetical protein
MPALRHLPFWAAILLATLLTIWAMQPPPPRVASADNEPVSFNLSRAIADLRIIARTPHATGSPANAAVRDYLVNEMASLGLSPEVQRGTAVHQDTRGQQVISIAPVENIVAILPGRDHTQPAIAVMAHYDSVPFSPGASDDGAGTVALLETARVLAAGPQPARDVLFLITDGEEFGLTGAQLFFDGHPMARRIGMVVNAEARGAKGRATMFQTSPGNAALVSLWADHAISPSGNSMSDAIYRILPNDTDMSVSLDRGVAGINAAFIGGHFDYHSTTDSVAMINRGSLQHLGDFVLTTTRALAMAAALPARDRDAVYFDLFGLTVVQYAPWLGWLPLLLAGLGLALLYRRDQVISVRRGLGGAAAAIAATAAAGGLCHAIGAWMMGSGSAQMREAMADIDIMIWPLAGLILAALLLVRPGRAMQLGAIAVLVTMGIAAQIFMPGAAMLFAWPALIAVGLTLAGMGSRASGAVLSTASVVIVGVVLGLIFQLVASAYIGVGLLSAGVMALALPFMVALLGPLLPATAEPAPDEASREPFFRRGRGVGVAMASLSVATISWLAGTDGFSARHPRPGDFFALHNVDNGRSYWATTSDASYLPAGPSARFRYEPFTRWRITTLPTNDLAAPGADRRIGIAHSTTAQGQRWEIAMPTAPRFMLLALKPSAAMRNVRLNGRRITLSADTWSRLFYRVPQPFTLQLTADGPADASMAIRYLYSTPGLPADAPRSAGLATNWTLLTGTHVVVGQWPVRTPPSR